MGYKVYINHDPGMTLTYFLPMSTDLMSGKSSRNHGTLVL